MPKRKLTSVKAIKEFFGEPKVTTKELGELSSEERAELGKLAAKELGAEWVPPEIL